MDKREVLAQIEIIRETPPLFLADVFASRMDQIDLLIENWEVLGLKPQSHCFKMILKADKILSKDLLAGPFSNPLWSLAHPPLSIELCDIVIRNALKSI